MGPLFAMVAGNPDAARAWPERAWWCRRRQRAAKRAAAAEGVVVVVVDEVVMLLDEHDMRNDDLEVCPSTDDN